MLALGRAVRSCLPVLTANRSSPSRTVFTTSHLHPSIRQLATELARIQPCFSVSAKNVRVLFQPTDFYSTLLDMIRCAKKRIFISSLYIGSEELELIQTLHSSLSSNPSLQLYMILDLNRSTRPGPASTTTLLRPLLESFPDRVHVSLFRSPKLKGIMAKVVPPRFNEGWGTWHAKIYGADDDVMISGANLNKSYFTNRQDRYILFASSPSLASYCFDFLQTVSQFSYKILPPTSFPTSSTGTAVDYTRAPQVSWQDPSTHPHDIESKASALLSKFQASHLMAPEELHAQPSDVPISSLTPSSAEATTGAVGGNLDDEVYVFPIIQAGQFNIREEERALNLLFNRISPSSSKIFSSASPTGMGINEEKGGDARPLVNLTSGYFGLYEPYQDIILKSDVDTRIVCAAPKANGFYGSSGISGRIPEGYTLLEQRFMRAVQAAGRSWVSSHSNLTRAPDLDEKEGYAVDEEGRGVELTEWEKEGWTYHAKGIWVSPTATSAPVLTLLGSTNLNSRSAELDTELSFLMLTSSPELREELAKEVNEIRSHVGRWKGAAPRKDDRDGQGQEDSGERGGRKVRFGTKLLVWLVGGML